MIDTDRVGAALRGEGLDDWAACLPAQLDQVLRVNRHGDLDRWLAIVASLPEVPATSVDLQSAAVTVAPALHGSLAADIRDRLLHLKPWRKGPYDLHGVYVDTEWRSDWKWQRLAPHIAPLAGRVVLDVGCGNGYHCWRMAGEGAALVVGIDPTQLFLAQFLAVQRFVGRHWPVHLLPLGIEQLPPGMRAFDTVFSMGVLYHRRSPIDHLLELRETLKPGGELVLETLVIEGSEGHVLMPEGRYAKMRNVWFLPSPAELTRWLRRCGFHDVRVVDVTATTAQEQRRTEWMSFESLANFLDPGNPDRTVEGYPAPRRAVLLATA